LASANGKRSKDQVRMLSFQSGFGSVKVACSRTIQTSGADRCARGASPSMRERRINEGYDAPGTGQVAS